MDIAITYKILLRLQEMFSDKGRPTRQATLRTNMNTRMIEETLLRNHIIHMITLFNKMDRKIHIHLT